ncbi:MAG: hypothetical protein LBE85_10025, partial [Candidatus Accumulibacter sp.]|nr:hypothetical protein [Accumulibacter sp.]
MAHIDARMQQSNNGFELKATNIGGPSGYPPSGGSSIPTIIAGGAARARLYQSPLVLDLDGDGVETLGTDTGVHFDHDGNGAAELSGWAGKDDGLLVLDRNGNGKIDNGGELFGNNTRLSNGQTADNGFAALAELDGNRDGIIDAQDAVFAQLRVWRDANSNGKTDDGELLTLEQAGVASLGIGYTNQNMTDEHGNHILQMGSYTGLDGAAHEMADIWFTANTADTEDWNTVSLPADIAALPDVCGSQTLPRLRQAMALDETGQLRALVEKFIVTTDAQAQAALLDKILFAWTDADQYDAHSRGDFLDGRKLYVLEAFLGEAWTGVNGANPRPDAATELMSSYNILADFVSEQILAQTHFRALYELVEFSFDTDSGQWIPDASKLVAYFREQADLDEESGQRLLNAFAANLGAVNEKYSPVIRDAINRAGALNGNAFEVALFSFGWNMITGDNANNALTGTNEDNLLIGKGGNDALQGGAGNDIYYFACGNGEDTIYDYDIWLDNKDAIIFAEDIAPEDIIVTRSGVHLVLNLRNTTDQITVQHHFAHGSFLAVEEIRFADGTVWDRAALDSFLVQSTDGNDDLYATQGFPDLSGGAGNDTLWGDAQANILNGGEGNDSLRGGDGDDLLSGGEGNDTLYGSSGNDILIGGAGNDILCGEAGNDVYRFARGGGQDIVYDYGYDKTSRNFDVIEFAKGIVADEVRVTRYDTHLVLNLQGTTDQITVQSHFYDSPTYAVEEIR